MRLALIWLLLILATLVHSADILILIHEKEAGPIIPAADYNQPTWILWPHSSNFLQSNRLFSLPSGVDWQTGYLDDAFVVKQTTARSIADRKWIRRGFFEAIAQHLGDR
ncbi:MAG: hypothetical protein H7Y17_01145, partial [Chlorobia bacterium]|nr:hypothetical protein [Fimbriimonadaceae bacterium]